MFSCAQHSAPEGPLLRASQTQQPQGAQQGTPGKPAFSGTQEINKEVFGGKKGTEKEAIRLNAIQVVR